MHAIETNVHGASLTRFDPLESIREHLDERHPPRREDREGFITLTGEYLMEYPPQTPTETHCVREMIEADWRLTRTRAQAASIQLNRMHLISEAPSIKVSAEAFRLLSDESNSVSLLLRCENPFRRQYDKSLSRLMELRRAWGADQPIEEQQPDDEELMTLDEYLNAPTPGELLSPEEMHALIERLSNEARAKSASANGVRNSNPINLRNEPKTSEATGLASTNPVNPTNEAQITRQAA